LVEKGLVGAYPYEDEWISIDSHKDLEEARRVVSRLQPLS
jgi:NDP-sugar pyrophosphorylase family protein